MSEKRKSPINAPFNWQDYLEQSGSVPQEESTFSHVQTAKNSLAERILKPGHLVSLPQIDKIGVIYAVFGSSALLKPLDDLSGEFVSAEICKLAPCPDEKLKEAQEILEKFKESDDNFLSEIDEFSTPSKEDLDLATLVPSEVVKCGQFVEVQDPLDPRKVFLAKIDGNHGGRLKISPVLTEQKALFLFFLDPKLHPVGWCTGNDGNEQECKYVYDDSLVQNLLTEAKENPVPETIFNLPDRPSISKHYFKVGMKLEVLDPDSQAQFFPGTVSQIVNSFYFVVQIDQLRRPNICEDWPMLRSIVCHRGTQGIFPVYWCYSHGIRLSAPNGYPESEFLWQTYRSLTNCSRNDDALDHIFDLGCESHNKYGVGRQLEVSYENGLRAATVTRVHDHLVWLQIQQNAHATHTRIFDYRSRFLFPCGWAQEHGLSLEPPFLPKRDLAKVPEARRMESVQKLFATSKRFYMPKHWIPGASVPWIGSIYINASCFSGPFLDPDKISELPRQYGPGPLVLVLQKLLNQLISCARRPKDVLDILTPADVLEKNRRIITVKARYRRRGRRTRAYRGPVEVVRQPDQLWHWSSRLLARLDACPNLFCTTRFGNEKKCDLECGKHLATLPFLAALKYSSTALRARASKRPLPRPRLRRPSLLAAAERAKRARPVAVVEARRPVTRGVKIPKYSAINSGLMVSPTRVGVKLVRNANRRQQSRTDLTKPLQVVTEPKPKPVALIPGSQKSPTKLSEEIAKGRYPIPVVNSNPNDWTAQQLCAWLKSTDSSGINNKLVSEEVDGQAFLLLTLKDCMEYLGMKLGPALKLCGIIQELKMVFLNRYSDSPMEP